MIRKSRGLLLADFTADPLANYINNDPERPIVRLLVAPYDQVTQILIDPNHACWKDRFNFAVIWTRPESAVPGFNRLLSGEPVSLAALLEQVDQFVDRIKLAAERVPTVLVPIWTALQAGRGWGLLDLKHPHGIAGNLVRLNQQLIEKLSEIDHVYPLDSTRWLASAGTDSSSPKLWYMAKALFGNRVFMEAARDIKAAVRSMTEEAIKLVVVDLDDTLWGGILGDIGWEKIQLGGHDPTGEAFVDFQRALLTLKNRGVILAIVSKNDETAALEAIRNHPEMVIREDDFAGWRINWSDKANNIVSLLNELNLGAQSVLFIDDSKHERSRVRQALPDVFVPEWPDDRMLYASTLRNLTCFDTPSVSIEDKNRTAMYAAQKERTRLQSEATGLGEWLVSLETVVTVRRLTDVDRDRTVQLLNKTNQMNLATRRLSAAEFATWAAQPDNHVFTLRVADKLGDSGLVGILTLTQQDERGHIADFVLSCRVLGRRIEETMLHLAARIGKQLNLSRVDLHYTPTERNKPCLAFLSRSGLDSSDDKRSYVINIDRGYALPEGIQLDESGL